MKWLYWNIFHFFNILDADLMSFPWQDTVLWIKSRIKNKKMMRQNDTKLYCFGIKKYHY